MRHQLKVATALIAVALAGVACAQVRRPAAAPDSPSTKSASPTPTVRPSPRHVHHVTVRVLVTHLRLADGAVVTLARFVGPVTFRLHNGSGDPGPLAAGRVAAGPVVTGAERRRLLAAFNGGFKLSADVGGYEQEGVVIRPLLRGLASLVIDRNGRAQVGVWGVTVPRPGEQVYSVRQNLPPLVLDGRPAATVGDPAAWGATLGGGVDVARAAVGETARGGIVVAATMYGSPADLADALVRAGVRTGMELDINPEWVQLDVAARPGGPLVAALPGQNRPADQYLYGWTRDFITVLAP
jgi:hypothetical protein